MDNIAQIETTKQNQNEIVELIHDLGTVNERFADGSILFGFYDAECYDEGTDTLEDFEIE